MKNYKTTNKASIIVAAAAFMSTPLAMAKEMDSTQRQENGSVRSQAPDTNLQVEINGFKVDAQQLRGAEVINSQNEKLGEIEDIVFKEDSGEATHLIVSTDNWFDGNSALIPAALISFRNSPDEDEYGKKILEWVRGESVTLDMSEEQFDEIATFQRGDDLESYLSEMGKELAQTLDIDEQEMFDDDASYNTQFVNRSERNRVGGLNAYATSQYTSDDENQIRFRSVQSPDESWESYTLMVDGERVLASELKGAVVVNRSEERLGKVVDIAINEKEEGNEYLVIRTDNWFDGEHAIVPIKSLTYHENADNPHNEDAASWWMGDHVVLDMSEEKFEQIADYRRSENFEEYIENNRDRLYENYNYEMAYSPMHPHTFLYSYPETPSSVATGNERKDHSDSVQSSFRPSRDQSIQLGEESIAINELRNTKVKDSESRTVATVSDVVFDANSEEAKFLVLERRSDDKMTLVPIAAVNNREKNEDMTESHNHNSSAACAFWDGKKLMLDTNTAQVDEWAAFTGEQDFSSFLENNASNLGDAFDMDKDEIMSKDAEYVFTFNNKDEYQTASR